MFYFYVMAVFAVINFISATSTQSNFNSTITLIKSLSRKEQVAKLRKLFDESYTNFDMFLKSSVEKVYVFANTTISSFTETPSQPYTMIQYCLKPLTLEYFQTAIKAQNSCKDAGHQYKFLYWIPKTFPYKHHENDINMLKAYFSEENVIIVDKSSLTSVFGIYSSQLIDHYTLSIASNTTSSSSSSSYSRSLFVDSLALYSYLMIDRRNRKTHHFVQNNATTENHNTTTTAASPATMAVNTKYLWIIDVGVTWIGDIAKVLMKWDTTASTTDDINTERAAKSNKNSYYKESSLDINNIGSNKNEDDVEEDAVVDFAAAGCINSESLKLQLSSSSITTTDSNGEVDDAVSTVSEPATSITAADRITTSSLSTSSTINTEAITNSIVTTTTTTTTTTGTIITNNNNNKRRRNLMKLTFDKLMKTLRNIRQGLNSRSQFIFSRLRRMIRIRRQRNSNSKSSNMIGKGDDSSSSVVNKQKTSARSKRKESKTIKRNKNKRFSQKQRLSSETGNDSDSIRQVEIREDEEEEEVVVVCLSDIARYSAGMLQLMAAEMTELDLLPSSNSNSNSNSSDDDDIGSSSTKGTNDCNSSGDTSTSDSDESNDDGSNDTSNGTGDGDKNSSSAATTVAAAVLSQLPSSEFIPHTNNNATVMNTLINAASLSYHYHQNDNIIDDNDESIKNNKINSGATTAATSTTTVAHMNTGITELLDIGLSEGLLAPDFIPHVVVTGTVANVGSDGSSVVGAVENDDDDSAATFISDDDFSVGDEMQQEEVNKNSSDDINIELFQNSSFESDTDDDDSADVNGDDNDINNSLKIDTDTTTLTATPTVTSFTPTITPITITSSVTTPPPVWTTAATAENLLTEALYQLSDFFDIYYPLYQQDYASHWKADFQHDFHDSLKAIMLNRKDGDSCSVKESNNNIKNTVDRNIIHKFCKINNNNNKFNINNNISKSYSPFPAHSTLISLLLQSLNLNDHPHTITSHTPYEQFLRIQEKFTSLTLPEAFLPFSSAVLYSRPGILFRNLSSSSGRML